MNCVLVNPMVTIPGWGSYYRRQPGRDGRKSCSLPHGLLQIATEINRVGHKASILDLRTHDSMADALADIARRKPEVVGCGAMTVDFGVLLELFSEVKRLLPEVTTVAGGVHASVATKDAEQHEQIDYIITGEAEITLTRMLDERFVGFDRVTQGEPPDLDMLLPIDRELMDYRGGELYHGVSWKAKAPYVTVMTARGCPYKCTFCHPVSTTMFGKPRQRSVAYVMAEMRWLKWRYNAAYFEFIDDYFTLKADWVNEFCDRYEADIGDVPFNVATRANVIVKQEQLFHRLKKVGLHTVNVGFESGSERILKMLHKGTTVEMNTEAGKILNKLDIKIIANVMFGFPGETARETMATIDMLDGMKADCRSPAFFTPYPGCQLYEEFKDKLISTDYSDLGQRHPDRPKIKGVDYPVIKHLVDTELRRGQ